MNFFWKKHKTGEVIHQTDYNNLKDEHKQNFSQTQERPTHQVEDEDDDGLPVFSILAGLEIADALSSDSGSSSTSDNSSSFGGFDGGSGGGGGAEGDWGGSSDSSSDSSSSFDSGSSDF